MNRHLMIGQTITVCWQIDSKGAAMIVNVIDNDNLTDLLYPGKFHKVSPVGCKGSDIGWTAEADVVIVSDMRHDGSCRNCGERPMQDPTCSLGQWCETCEDDAANAWMDGIVDSVHADPNDERPYSARDLGIFDPGL